MVAGISGATPGSGVAVGEEDENDGRLMLLHAPRNIVNAEAIPRLATPRALRDLTMAFPRANFVAAPVPQPSVKLLSEQ
jgi:hypothetical protein